MRQRNPNDGFTYLEVLVGTTLLLISLLGVCGMFIAGYSNVTGAGNKTEGLAAGRQLLEEMRRLPYANMVNLNGFDTENAQTLPAADPEREIARRWRYVLAGEGVGWNFTDDEKDRWPTLAGQGDKLGASGTIAVTQPSATLSRVELTVSVPGSWRPIQLATLITEL